METDDNSVPDGENNNSIEDAVTKPDVADSSRKNCDSLSDDKNSILNNNDLAIGFVDDEDDELSGTATTEGGFNHTDADQGTSEVGKCNFFLFSFE